MSEPIYRVFRVAQVIPEGSCGATLILDGALPAQPGQFIMAWLPGIEERPFSLMDDDPLSLSIADTGPFTRALCALKPGERLWVRGPFGRGFALSGRRHLLIGGGSGTAGLALLAKRALAAGHDLRVVIGARSAGQLMLAWRCEDLGAPVALATDDGSTGFHGTALGAAEEWLATRWPEGVYACGPQGMARAVARRCRELGLPCWLSLESTMRCAIGVCGSCNIGERLVCQDGPVFAAEEIFPNSRP
jgi:dihydroorotate dehydrogenase electron transfer subunit